MIYHYLNVKQDKIREQVLPWRLQLEVWFKISMSKLWVLIWSIPVWNDIYTYVWFSTVIIYHYLNVKQDKICEQVLTWRLQFSVCVQNDHHWTSVNRCVPLSVKHVFCNLFIRIVLQQPKYNKATDIILADWGLEIRVANVWAITTGLSPSVVLNGICSQ